MTNLNDLIREGAWEKLKNHPDYQELSYEKKILTAKKAINNKLYEAETIFKETIRDDLKSAGIIMDKRIKPLRNLIKALNACYAGTLTDTEAKQVTLMLGITPPKPTKG